MDGLYRHDTFYARVWISLNRCDGLQGTCPRWFSLVPSMFGLVLDWLRFTVACFGAKNWTELNLLTLLTAHEGWYKNVMPRWLASCRL